jgi:hypothetical protein
MGKISEANPGMHCTQCLHPARKNARLQQVTQKICLSPTRQRLPIPSYSAAAVQGSASADATESHPEPGEPSVPGGWPAMALPAQALRVLHAWAPTVCRSPPWLALNSSHPLFFLIFPFLNACQSWMKFIIYVEYHLNHLQIIGPIDVLRTNFT